MRRKQSYSQDFDVEQTYIAEFLEELIDSIEEIQGRFKILNKIARKFSSSVRKRITSFKPGYYASSAEALSKNFYMLEADVKECGEVITDLMRITSTYPKRAGGLSSIFSQMARHLSRRNLEGFTTLAEKVRKDGESMGLDQDTVNALRDLFEEVEEVYGEMENWQWQYNYLMGRD